MSQSSPKFQIPVAIQNVVVETIAKESRNPRLQNGKSVRLDPSNTNPRDYQLHLDSIEFPGVGIEQNHGMLPAGFAKSSVKKYSL